MSTKVKVDKIKEGSIPFNALAPLNDTDKNQALANLGIDPVVWKYMCNPRVYVLEEGVPLPSDLRNIIENANGRLKNITLKILLIGRLDENDDLIVENIKSIHTSGNSIELFDGTTLYYSDGRLFKR